MRGIAPAALVPACILGGSVQCCTRVEWDRARLIPCAAVASAALVIAPMLGDTVNPCTEFGPREEPALESVMPGMAQ